MSRLNSSKPKLVIVRHGESEWNAHGKWTGLTDVHLTAKGEYEAAEMGSKLADIEFDKVFVSQQVRTQETANQLLVAAGQAVKYQIEPAINERDYGVHTGKNKWQVQKEVGEEVFHRIRRGWDEPIKGGETLKQVHSRVVPFYKDQVVPLLRDGKTVLIVAHGNSIRALIKYIESISDSGIETVEMIFGQAVIYELDNKGKMLTKTTRSILTKPPEA